MYEKELRRIYEIRDAFPHPDQLDASLAAIPRKLTIYREIEADLQALDELSWHFLKSELVSCRRDSKRGWQSLFDKLNQAKAYRYLKGAGYTDIEFIPPSSLNGCKTPDLRACRKSEKALCEVKTINVSDVEVQRRASGGVQAISDQLDPEFFDKLRSTLTAAESQIKAYESEPATKKIAYVIVNFDDRFHEYANHYQNQIAEFTSQFAELNMEIVFNIKPAFAAG
jgi:hypothetical protein